MDTLLTLSFRFARAFCESSRLAVQLETALLLVVPVFAAPIALEHLRALEVLASFDLRSFVLAFALRSSFVLTFD